MKLLEYADLTGKIDSVNRLMDLLPDISSWTDSNPRAVMLLIALKAARKTGYKLYLSDGVELTEDVIDEREPE